MDPLCISLAKLFIWEEPGSPDIKIGNRAAAEIFSADFSSLSREFLPPYRLIPEERPFVSRWDHESVVACGGASSPVHMRISGHRTAAFWSKVFAPLVTDRRENQETIDMIEAPDGSVSIWQGLERVEDPGGADGAMAQPGGDIRFILPQLWFGDRVCGILHGCAMEWHGKTFALLGKSGAGKSTLAAHLASQGARYVSDDLLFLLDDGTVPRLVMPPSIKIGAWDLVSPHFPALQTVPSFLKGETAFRLMPDAPFISEEAGDMPQHFFFLGFTAGRVLAVDQIDLDEVFLRLSSVGLWVRNGRLAEITGMLRPAKWHWLRHGDSAEAGEAIAGILDS